MSHLTMAAGNHKCFAIGCSHRAPSSRFGCRKHWFSLPVTMRDAINDLYHAGRAMSKDYCELAIRCIREVAKREGKTTTGDEREFRVYRRLIARHDENAKRARNQYAD